MASLVADYGSDDDSEQESEEVPNSLLVSVPPFVSFMFILLFDYSFTIAFSMCIVKIDRIEASVNGAVVCAVHI